MRDAVQGRDTSVRGIISKECFVQGVQHPRAFGRGHINPASKNCPHCFQFMVQNPCSSFMDLSNCLKTSLVFYTLESLFDDMGVDLFRFKIQITSFNLTPNSKGVHVSS